MRWLLTTLAISAFHLSAAEGGPLGNEMWETLERGGEVMYAILAASVIGIAFVLESLFRTRRGRILPRFAENQLHTQRAAAVSEVMARAAKTCVGEILAAAIQWEAGTPEQRRQAIEEAVENHLWKLRRGVRPIGVIANVTPLLGLLGTVVGIIEAFDTVSQQGALGDPAALAGGISKALLTTCFGLIVAIPLLLSYHYLTGRLDARLHRCEELVKEALLLPTAPAPDADA